MEMSASFEARSGSSYPIQRAGNGRLANYMINWAKKVSVLEESLRGNAYMCG
jgi:hypothetical protein